MPRVPVAAVGSSLLVAALLSAASLAQPAHSAERPLPMPKTLTLDYAQTPIWVDASVALTESGAPNPVYFGDEAPQVAALIAKTGSGECREVGPKFEDAPFPPRRGSLDEAVGDSQVALFGRIVDKAFGFYSDVPAELLQVEPIHSFGLKLAQPRYYFSVPIARFRIGGTEVCKTDPRFAEPPEVGDEVFLFVPRPEGSPAILLPVIDPGDIVPVNHDGSLRLPPQYADHEAGGKRSAPAMRHKAELLAKITAVKAKGTHR
jgi:hypothetical protein